MPLPAGLPAPVERFYHALYGDRVPVITTAVLSGRCWMRPAGPLMLPARFRLTHIAGHAYRHYIEMTFFGIPLIRANEYYRDGRGRMDITVIGTDEGTKYDQAANIALWAEALYFPSLFLTDPAPGGSRSTTRPRCSSCPSRTRKSISSSASMRAPGWSNGRNRCAIRRQPAANKVLWLNHSLSTEVREQPRLSALWGGHLDG